MTELIRYRSSRRYYRTDQIWTDAEVPVGTTGQIRYRIELIRYRSTCRYYRTYAETGLFKYWSTRRYYRTDQRQDLYICRSTRRYYRTDHIRTYTDAGVPVGTTEQIRYTDAGVPVGTTGQIGYRTYQIQEYL